LFSSQKVLVYFAIAVLTFSFDVKLVTAQTAYKWRLAMSWPEGTPMLGNAAVRFALNVKKCLVGVLSLMPLVDTKRHWVFLTWSDQAHTASCY